MPGRSRKRPRFTTPKPTRKGVLLTLATAVLAWGGASSAAVNAFHFKAPSVALALDADDPVALVRDAQVRFNIGEIEGGSDEMLGIVRRSVSELALNGPAFRLYGLTSAANADLPAVRAQMEVSDQLERRDAAAQLWLIENAVQQNDVNQALRHYDTALRIQESSRALLYPALTGSLESPLIRERFLPYLNAPPPWLDSFLRYAVSNTQSPTAIAELARLSGGFPDGPAYSSLDRELLTQLVAFEEYEAAIEHFSGITEANQAVLTDLALTDDTTDNAFAPITWQPFQIDGIETFLLASPAGGGAVEIEAEVEAGYKGPVARKLMAFAPGEYALQADLRAEGFNRPDRVRWTIRCAGQTDILPLLRSEEILAEEFRLTARFSVPAGCPVQTLMVSADTVVSTGYVKLVLGEVTTGPVASDTAEETAR